MSILLVAAVALVDRDRRVLLTQRPLGKSYEGYWEFPGGKIEETETPEGAAVRELWEELHIEIDPSCLSPVTFASHSYPDFHLLMTLYICRRWKGNVQSKEGQAMAWVLPKHLRSYTFLPADVPLISPLFSALIS